MLEMLVKSEILMSWDNAKEDEPRKLNRVGFFTLAMDNLLGLPNGLGAVGHLNTRK